MPKYQKRPDLPYAVISGVGVLKDDRVIEGEFDAYVPGILVQVQESVVVPALVPVTEPAPEPAPAPAPEPAPEALGAAVVDVLYTEVPSAGASGTEEVAPTRKFPKGKRR